MSSTKEANKSFVDEVRKSFDAYDFCETLRAAVGHGRSSAEKALRDASAVAAAQAALDSFLEFASGEDGPDVVAALLSYSPSARELFDSLRAVSAAPGLTSSALDAIIAIVRYGQDEAHPPLSLKAAHAVVKEIVKTHVPQLSDIFHDGDGNCCKKALILLRLVSETHPWLAKEIVNRFNLTGPYMAPALFSVTNNRCRRPFLLLLTTILTEADHDVTKYFTSNGRQLLISVLTVVLRRLSVEIEYGRIVDPPSTSEVTHFRRRKVAQESQDSDVANFKISPSYVQQRELDATMEFLDVFQNRFFSSTNNHAHRKAFAAPIPSVLSQIASIQMPPLHVAPSQVTEHHRKLRQKARNIFASAAADPHLIPLSPLVKIVCSRRAVRGEPVAVDFVMHVIRARPDVSKLLLERGHLFSHEPRLSASWLAVMSLISACTVRLLSATSIFRQRGFFSKCLSHEDALIRHYGMLLLLAFCRVLEQDEAALGNPLQYIPNLKEVRQAVLKARPTDAVARKLLATYQGIFAIGNQNANGAVFASLQNAKMDFASAEDSLRTALRTAPRESVEKIIQLGCFSSLLLQKGHATPVQSLGMWSLCSTILRQTGLFPENTQREIDVLLCTLSSRGNNLKTWALAFDDVLKQARNIQYALFDDVHKASDSRLGRSGFTVSLFSAAIVRRLRKLKDMHAPKMGDDSPHSLQDMLKNVLLNLFACEKVRLASQPNNAFLETALLEFVDNDNPWYVEGVNAGCTEKNIAEACEVVRDMMEKAVFKDTPYLKLVSARCSFSLDMRDYDKFSSDETDSGLTFPTSSAVVWDASRVYSAGSGNTAHQRFDSNLGNPYERSLTNNSAAGLILEMRGIPQSLSVSDQLEECSKVVSTEDMAVFLGTILASPLQSGEEVSILKKAVQLLSSDMTRPTNSDDTFSFLQESFCKAVQRSATLGEDVAGMLFEVAFKRLENCSKPTSEDMKFFFVLMDSLTSHSNHTLSTVTQLRLASTEAPEVLTLEVLSTELVDLTCKLLPYFPKLGEKLRKSIFTQTNVQDGHLSLHLLPVIHCLLSLRDFTKNGCDLRSASRQFLLSRHNLVNNTTANANVRTYWESKCLLALREIGKHAKLNEVDVQRIISTLPGLYDPKSRKQVPIVAWMYFLDSSRTTSPQTRISVPTSNIYDITRQLAEVIVASPLDAEDHLQQLGTAFLIETLIDIKQNRSTVFKKGEMVPVFKSHLVAICNYVFKQTKKLINGCKPGARGKLLDERLSSSDVRLLTSLLRCLSLFLDLDVMDSEFADKLIRTCNSDEWSFVKYTRKQEALAWKAGAGPFLTSCLPALSQMIQAAVRRISHPMIPETISSLSTIAHLLSTNIGNYSMTLSSADTSIRDAICSIRQKFTAGSVGKDNQGLLSLGGAFRPKPAYVLFTLEKTTIENAQEALFSFYRNDKKTTALDSQVIPRSSSLGNQIDAKFILSIFFQACREALHSPSTPVLDLGKVIKEGHLALVVMGMSTPDSTIRSLSYACIELFSELVGPTSKIPPGHSAGLYRERKQLSFALGLLRNSVEKPQEELPPLFCAWFVTAVRVLLNPGHAANKIISNSMLRTPVQEATEGFCVSDLLNLEGSESDLIATRHLGLDILRRGLRSVRDAQVARRRRYLDSILFLASLGGTSHASIRTRAIGTLRIILSRGDELGLAADVTRSHGLVAWISCDAAAGTSFSENDIINRLLLLRQVAQCAHMRNDGAPAVASLAASFETLQSQIIQSGMLSSERTTIRRTLLETAAAITKVQAEHRSVLDLDIHAISRDLTVRPLVGSERKNFFTTVAHQRNFESLDSSVVRLMLEYCLQTNGGEAVWDLDLAMTHSTVSDWIMLHQFNGEKDTLRTSWRTLLSRVILSQPTVWLIVGALFLIKQHGHMSEEVEALAANIPATIPRVLSAQVQQTYTGVIENCRFAVAQTLIDIG